MTTDEILTEILKEIKAQTVVLKQIISELQNIESRQI